MRLGGKNATKRGKVSIIADILDIADGGVLKTHIMYGANLSFRQLDNYLALLSEISLLEKSMESQREIYKTTDRGRNFLQHYYEIKELLTSKDENNHKRGIKEPPLQLLQS